MDDSTQAQPSQSKSMTRRSWIRSIVLFLTCSAALLWYSLVRDDATDTEVWQLLPDDALATSVTPDDIMSKPLASGVDLYTMPKLIHQSWMNDELPKRMQRWSRTCRAQHRHWQWLLWTDKDNLKMVETYFPWFLDTYRALPAEINRADASRNMYMYLFGGVYADLDTECLQPLDNLFYDYDVGLTNSDGLRQPTQVPFNVSGSHVAFFGRMGFDGTDDTLYHTIPNAWMASTPGHPFFLFMLQRLRAAVFASQNDKFSTTAEDLTGPIALYHGIEEYNSLLDQGSSFAKYFAESPSYDLFDRSASRLQIELLPPETIYPYSWNNEGSVHRSVCWTRSIWFNSRKCKQRVTTNRSYTITYWSHTWSEDLHKEHSKHGLDSVG